MGEPDERFAVWCNGKEWCPVTASGEFIGRKWHPAIVHTLLENGPLRFNELQREVDGISGKVLSESLEDMEAKQLVDRMIVNEKPVHVEYSLTNLGTSLEPVIDAINEWSDTHLRAADSEDQSIV